MSDFKAHHVVPDVIDSYPPYVCTLHFSTKHEPTLGGMVSPKDANKEPKIKFPTEETAHYTVVMVDPDCPSRHHQQQHQLLHGERKHYLHLLLVNVAGSTNEHMNLHTGHAVCPYVGPSPPKGSGAHRYVILIYKQNHVMDNYKMDSLEKERGDFDLEKWMGKQFGKERPELVAGNFFQSQNE